MGPDRNCRFLHRVGARQRGRAAVGYQFRWRGQLVTVTSFAADGQSLTACSYQPDPGGGYSRRIGKRYTITQADLREHRSSLKQFA